MNLEIMRVDVHDFKSNNLLSLQVITSKIFSKKRFQFSGVIILRFEDPAKSSLANELKKFVFRHLKFILLETSRKSSLLLLSNLDCPLLLFGHDIGDRRSCLKMS